MHAIHPLALLQAMTVISAVSAATADQWRGRSIYQVVTDRYAIPADADPTKCDPADRTWCGGTWKTITENLDYIQDAGFTAIWISPVSQNYEGPRTVYGDAYHGYWIADHSQLNDRFGSSDDLMALSNELHRRGMYLMVDTVANDVMSTSLNPDLSTYMFKNKSQYHPYCPINWNNETSVEYCWLGDTNVPLPDLNTEDPTVIAGLGNWIKSFVQQYNVDGLRIDAARHVPPTFWNSFCRENAQVFCMGEVFSDDIGLASQYQNVLGSVLNYPMRDALAEAFAIPGPQNLSAATDTLVQLQKQMHDTTVLGNFLENQDIPRWATISIDPQTLYNAMTWTFMSDGIPIVYYGQEQYLQGNADPFNRGPLWPSGYALTTAYNVTKTLNMLRNHLVITTDWATSPTRVLAKQANGTVIMKGDVVSILTNIGSPPANLTVYAYTPWEPSSSTRDIFSCTQYVVGSSGTVEASYAEGGQAVVLVPDTVLQGSGLCVEALAANQQNSAQVVSGDGSTFSAHPFGLLSLFIVGLSMVFMS